MKKYFDKIYCINLDSRPERWQESLIEFEKLGLDVERVAGYQMSPGIAGCSKSHLECIKLAKINGYQNVLVLEDDITFHSDIFEQTLTFAMEQLEKNKLEYDMLYFSANLYGAGNTLIDDNLAKIKSAKAGHAYVVSKNVYDTIIDAFRDIDWGDLNNWHHGNPNRMNMDTWYKNIQQLGNTYGIYPSIAEQRKGLSDLINMDLYYGISEKYNKFLKTNQQW